MRFLLQRKEETPGFRPESFIFIQIFLCLIFSYVMLRTFNFSKVTSFFGAIVFSFNAFVIMRLSPGVGLEYLFAYKWIPLILAFSKKYLDNGNKLDLLGLTIAFAFSFEGNISIVIASGLLWLLYILTSYRREIKSKFIIFAAPVFSVFIYAIKLFPIVDLVRNGESRFSQGVDGWRASNFDLYMFPKVFFPFKHEFTNGAFTPGVIAISLFFFGLILALVYFFKTKKQPFASFYFSIITLVLAFFITIENPIYYFFYSLPILKMVTIIPSFLIFFVIPIVFLSSYAFSRLLNFVKNTKFYYVIIFIPILVFAEVLIGPSTFGSKTYSFNFAKINYLSEVNGFSHYNLLKDQKPGLFIVKDNPKLFIYPYAISTLNLKTLNDFGYFFGCRDNRKLLNSNISEIKKRANYIFSMYPLEDSELKLLGKVDMNTMLKLKSHSVFENTIKYLSLYDTGWNDDIYLYVVNCKKDCALKDYSDNPVSFSIPIQNNNVTNGQISTSINYSKWLKAKNGKNILQSGKDEFDYMIVKGDGGETLSFTYFNPYIYIGLGISVISFITFIHLFLRFKSQK